MAGFKISKNKGFHITFENGNTVSVQFGYGNYCSNYNNRDLLDQKNGAESHDAECAAWGSDGAWNKLGEYDDVIGQQSPADVLTLLNRMAGNPYASEAPAMVEALREAHGYATRYLAEDRPDFVSKWGAILAQIDGSAEHD